MVTRFATWAFRLMSACRLSTSSSILPTESCGTFNRTSGAVELLMVEVGTDDAEEVEVEEGVLEEEDGAGVEGMEVVVREVVPDGTMEDGEREL
jgi:hypothetical protein